MQPVPVRQSLLRRDALGRVELHHLGQQVQCILARLHACTHACTCSLCGEEAGWLTQVQLKSAKSTPHGSSNSTGAAAQYWPGGSSGSPRLTVVHCLKRHSTHSMPRQSHNWPHNQLLHSTVSPALHRLGPHLGKQRLEGRRLHGLVLQVVWQLRHARPVLQPRRTSGPGQNRFRAGKIQGTANPGPGRSRAGQVQDREDPGHGRSRARQIQGRAANMPKVWQPTCPNRASHATASAHSLRACKPPPHPYAGANFRPLHDPVIFLSPARWACPALGTPCPAGQCRSPQGTRAAAASALHAAHMRVGVQDIGQSSSA